MGTGTLLSGSPFLALVRDSMPKARQGIALSTIETALIVFFPIAAISFSLLLKEYTLVGFWSSSSSRRSRRFFWFFAIVGVERAVMQKAAEHTQEKARAQFKEFHATFAKIWQTHGRAPLCSFSQWRRLLRGRRTRFSSRSAQRSCTPYA